MSEACRHFIADVLTRWRLHNHLDTATLLASEVITNAVVHADTPFVVEVSADLDRRELMIAVRDFSTRPALNPISALGLQLLLADPDLDEESGRGLMIVASLADRWGIHPAQDGKTVWFILNVCALQVVPDHARTRCPQVRDSAVQPTPHDHTWAAARAVPGPDSVPRTSPESRGRLRARCLPAD